MATQSNRTAASLSSESPTTTKRPKAASSNGTFSSYFQNAYRQVERAIERNPKTSMLVPFAIGIGAGLAIGMALAGSTRSRQDDAWFGRQFMDSLAERLPASIGQKLHS